MKHVQRTCVGWIVIIIILTLLLAADPSILGFERAGFIGDLIGSFLWVGLLVVASLICTGGISLIIWIPLGYGVGWIVIVIAKTIAFYLGLKKDKGTTSAAGAPPQPQISKLQALTERLNQELQNDPALARNQLALVNYIRKAREKGISNHQISLDLTNNGWTMESITAAYQIVHSLK